MSIILLLAGIGAMASYYASIREHAPPPEAPANDPLLGSVATPSQRAIVKYFWVVAALLVVQILLGVVTAHYGVEGSGFYGIPLAEWLPYAVSRTWHVQLGIFWIATAWLAAGLYMGPAISGVEPPWQRLGVNVLFAALLVVVLGSMVGQWMSVKQMLGTGTAWFYFGHSGYEYIDLGPAVADRAAGRAVPVAGAHGPGDPPGPARAKRAASAPGALSDLDDRHRGLLSGSARLRAPHEPRSGRVPGGGGSSTSGSRASSRCSRPWSSLSCLPG